MRVSDLFNKLDFFFDLFSNNPTAADLRKSFLTIIENIDSRKGISEETVSIENIYEASIKFIEDKVVDSGFDQELLGLQRDLYVELEHILSLGEHDNRHHFLIVIPVAERPLMLKNCLDSLLEQCRIFQYGLRSVSKNGPSFYNKVSVFIFDDSKDETSISRIKEIVSGTNASGIRTYYIGLEEQAGLIQQISGDIKENLKNLLGDTNSPVASHKGASVTRNLAYLYLQSFLGDFGEKVLIYFMDSDEEFGIRINSADKVLDIPFINYFFRLNSIFSNSDIEVLTGKVVGDPPVSSAVMISTFLDDIILFFDSISKLTADDKCVFHKAQVSGAFSAEYHDMVKLFGYNSPLSPKEYYCGLTEAHSIKDCFTDFADKTSGFFSGVHPTRTQFYLHNRDITKTIEARTVYTGNYVFTGEGLRNFIPFANLKLRMAGPTLGRILRSRLHGRFRSANLPLLHKRTLSDKHTGEFRSGIQKDKENIDLSGEFIKQFWGDVMLFSVDELIAHGYPDRETGVKDVTAVVNRTCSDLHDLYIEQQTETHKKIQALKNYLYDPSFWWNTVPAVSGPLRKFRLFCSTVENNFGPKSPVMQKLSEQIKTKIFSEKIILAIHSFNKDEFYWKKSLLSLSKKTFKSAAGE